MRKISALTRAEFVFLPHIATWLAGDDEARLRISVLPGTTWNGWVGDGQGAEGGGVLGGEKVCERCVHAVLIPSMVNWYPA